MRKYYVGFSPDFAIAIVDELMEPLKPVVLKPLQSSTKGLYQKRYKAEVNQNNNWRKGKSRFSGYCSSTGV